MVTPPGEDSTIRQGTIRAFDTDTFENVIEYDGLRVTDVPVASGLEALTYVPGDVVLLEGWFPGGKRGELGIGSIWIRGRVITPGATAAQQVIAPMTSSLGRAVSAQVFADRIKSASVAANEATSSGTFGDLTTPGPTVTAEITDARAVVVIVTARIHAGVLGTTSGGLMGFDVSGASTLSFEQSHAAQNVRFFADEGISDTQRASALSLVTAADGLNAGTNTFTAKYATGGAGTATFQFRNITVIGF
jgi:hypothetical protein